MPPTSSAEVAADYEKVRASTRTRRAWRWLPLAQARANVAVLRHRPPVQEEASGVTVLLDIDPLAAAVHRLGPFFQTWDLAGAYPKILDDEKVGEAARNVFKDAQAMLEDHRENGCANAVFGLGRKRIGDDVDIVYTDERRTRSAGHDAPPAPAARTSIGQAALLAGRLRRTEAVRPTGPAPSPSPPASASRGPLAEFEATHDDYRAIMLKALADRPPKPAPSGCTSACARRLGLRRHRALPTTS